MQLVQRAMPAPPPPPTPHARLTCPRMRLHAHPPAGCLQQWQRLLWETGQCQKALHCDICKQPYREGFASAPFGPAEPLAARVTRVAQRLARSPERAVRLWRYAILAGGLAVAARQGLTGLSVGACLGVRLAAPLAAFLFKLAPEVGLLAALVPASKPAVRLMCCLFGGALAVEVTLASAAGLVAGGVIGFCRGSAGVVRATADVGCASARGALALLGGVANAGGLLPTWSGLGRSRAAGGAAQQA